jgi:hypothetical protein
MIWSTFEVANFRSFLRIVSGEPTSPPDSDLAAVSGFSAFQA